MQVSRSWLPRRFGDHELPGYLFDCEDPLLQPLVLGEGDLSADEFIGCGIVADGVGELRRQRARRSATGVLAVDVHPKREEPPWVRPDRRYQARLGCAELGDLYLARRRRAGAGSREYSAI